ncbi:unnamed protein product [Ostreobium quekettii]|uniref:Uncharacterized protein n=1 Tax=Ostreobium quekettii TaxID=121088 RepID=A0A8S1ITX9_9CHLO|nr:unnamed protein product [Ostreobium quekettii]
MVGIKSGRLMMDGEAPNGLSQCQICRQLVSGCIKPWSFSAASFHITLFAGQYSSCTMVLLVSVPCCQVAGSILLEVVMHVLKASQNWQRQDISLNSAVCDLQIRTTKRYLAHLQGPTS